jgi:hypothetical protein
MTAPEESHRKPLPVWRDLLALPLSLLGSLAGCMAGARLFYYIWDQGPFVPGVVGLCVGLAVLILTRRGGTGVAVIAAAASTIMQLVLHHDVRPWGTGDFYEFLSKFIPNVTPATLAAHALGVALAGGLAGALPLLWKKK